MVGEIKKQGGIRIHRSHIFKNSLASSRQGPEHGCSRPVMLTQQAGTLHHLLQASSLSLSSRAGYLNTPFQQVPKHSSAPQSYQTPDAPKDAASTVQSEITLSKGYRASLGHTGMPSQIWADASAAVTSPSLTKLTPVVGLFCVKVPVNPWHTRAQKHLLPPYFQSQGVLTRKQRLKVPKTRAEQTPSLPWKTRLQNW